MRGGQGREEGGVEGWEGGQGHEAGGGRAENNNMERGKTKII